MSSARLLVLGTILRHGIAHGYAVYQDLASWRAETWTNVKPGSIYHAMEKLESQGLIEAVDSGDRVKRGPARTEYALTEQGKAEFVSLLEAALKNNDIQLYAAGIAFMELLPRERIMALLKERLASLRDSAAFLKTLPIEALPSAPSRHPELVGVWVGYVECAASATQNLIQSLAEGKYRFLGESEGKS